MQTYQEYEQKMRLLIRTLFELSDNQQIRNDWEETMTSTLEALGQLLLIPILSRLPATITQLTFLLSAQLFLFPFHAVPLSNNPIGRVCDRYQVSYAPSVDVLTMAKARASREMIPSLYAVINPEADAKLLFTPFAGRAIIDLFSHYQMDEGLKATRERVATEISGRSYIHFSCHGYYNWDEPTDSGVVLADGSLTLAQLQKGVVDLSSARLVTLSACETGISDVIYGSPEEYVGIPAGFLMAGVPCVVSSLWAVEELSTALLMERFYHNHLQQGMHFAVALGKAQVWIRELAVGDVTQQAEKCYRQALPRDKPALLRSMRYYRHLAQQDPTLRPFAHPYYWAAFTCTGA